MELAFIRKDSLFFFLGGGFYFLFFFSSVVQVSFKLLGYWVIWMSIDLGKKNTFYL